MNWFYRFALGFPARAKDAAAVRRAIPELLRRDNAPQQRLHFRPFQTDFETHAQALDALRRWIEEVESPSGSALSESPCCSLSGCPLRSPQTKTDGDGGPVLAHFMVAGGGPNDKPPKARFLDLVRRTHKDQGPPRDVILTDPYIYADADENGLGGGHSNLVDYLKALGLTRTAAFTIYLTPAPRRQNSKAKEKLHRHLAREYKRIVIKSHSSSLRFHDRFYVVRHASGNLRGVFGPSLNGLASDAIVLMGDISEAQPQSKLESWFGRVK